MRIQFCLAQMADADFIICYSTEKNLDRTANHNMLAEDKAKELKRLNGEYSCNNDFLYK